MKKTLLILSAMLLLASLVMTACACTGGDAPADTTTDTVVGTTADTTADTVTETQTEAVTEGEKVLTNADYVKAYNAAIKAIFGEIKQPTTTANITPTVKHLAYKDATEGDNQNYYAVGAYVFFLRNLYELDSFERTEEAVHLTATYDLVIEGQKGGETMDCTMRNFRTEDGMLRSDLYQSATEGDITMQQYIQIDIDYDFETEVLSSFDFTILLIANGEVFQFENFKYDGSSIKGLDTEVQDDDYTKALNDAKTRMADIEGRVANAKDIGDFSQQYDDAMTEQFKIAYPDINVQ